MQRMEEPSAPTWDSDSPDVLSPWSPPPLDEDVPFPNEVSRCSRHFGFLLFSFCVRARMARVLPALHARDCLLI